jgi:hypothetical protein
MVKAKELLINWITNFINVKASMSNIEIKIEKNKENFDLIANYPEKKVYIIVEPFIKDFQDLKTKINKKDHTFIITFNSIENFNQLLTNWNRLINYENLTIYFINTFSKSDIKWIIKPYMHNKIADQKSLKTGLKSMFEMVEEVTKQEIEKKL